MFCDLQMQALKMWVAKSMDKTPEFSWNVPVVLDLVDTLTGEMEDKGLCVSEF